MRLWRGVLGHWHTRWPEWGFAGIIFGEAVLLRAYDTLDSQPVYQTLRSMVSNDTLSTAGFCISISWAVALALNGTFIRFRRISPWIRAVFGMAASCYWGLWAYTMHISNPVGGGWLDHAGLSVMAAVCSLMTAGDVAVADERASACRQRKLQNTGSAQSLPSEEQSAFGSSSGSAPISEKEARLDLMPTEALK